ncbi:MAG TPA: hypothetical protein VIV10_01800 [Gemmatimonadales bacterium]
MSLDGIAARLRIPVASVVGILADGMTAEVVRDGAERNDTLGM